MDFTLLLLAVLLGQEGESLNRISSNFDSITNESFQFTRKTVSPSYSDDRDSNPFRAIDL